jgi:hypothetical protein
MPMTLLRCNLSGLYFKSFGLWVRDPEEARSFSDPRMAQEFARMEHIGNATAIERSDLNVEQPFVMSGPSGHV